MFRFAIRHSSNPIEEARVMGRYMPSGYTAAPVTTPEGRGVLIAGEDIAGWTLDDYVLPRLASGLYFAREVSEDYAATCTPIGVLD